MKSRYSYGFQKCSLIVNRYQYLPGRERPTGEVDIGEASGREDDGAADVLTDNAVKELTLLVIGVATVEEVAVVAVAVEEAVAVVAAAVAVAAVAVVAVAVAAVDTALVDAAEDQITKRQQ